MFVEHVVWTIPLANSAQPEGFWVSLLGGIIAAFGARAGILGLGRLIPDIRECDDQRKVIKMAFRGIIGLMIILLFIFAAIIAFRNVIFAIV